jgi:type II secretory pathway pseudopilin PulG
MQVAPLLLKSQRRTGITLMEVLVSIGILAIGLTSAMSLIPAGKSEAGKALIYDRAATMAMNGLTDAVVFGLTRPASVIVATPAAATIVFDNDPTNPIPSLSAMASSAALKASGVLASVSDPAAAPAVTKTLFLQSRDDVVYNRPATDDGIPSNGFINGIRGFEGRMTSVIALTGSGTAPITAGEFATLSVIMFHNRDTSTPPLTASLSAAGLVTLVSALPTGRTLKSILRPGTVIFYEDAAINGLRFAQLGMAAVDTQAGNAFVTFAGRANTLSPPSTIYICVDSVGLAEKTVSLEGPSPYGQ